MVKKYGFPVLLGALAAGLVIGLGAHFLEESLKYCLPVMAYQTENGLFGIWSLEKLEQLLPVLSYSKENNVVARREDSFEVKKIKQVELLTLMEFENQEDVGAVPTATEVPVQESVGEEQELPETSEAEEAEVAAEAAFVPHSLQTIVNMQELSDYETLIKKFYTVDSVAMIGSDLLDAEILDGMDLRISKESQGPQILIYHTHSQEGFADSVAGDDETTIIGVGEHLAEILREQYGYEVLHHTGKYDVESRDNAYSKALPEIEQLLEENPSIQVVIDLHRDAVADESNKLVMDLDGRPTARFMFFNGVSCTRKTGSIDYLYNPNLTENLALSFQLKKVAEEYYPGLTRKNYINGYRYNMHLCGKTTLIELGAQNNTLEEAMNACDPIAHILDMVLSGA